jgi:beta-galactosidase
VQLSRRGFLEVSSRCAAGVVLAKAVQPMEAQSELAPLAGTEREARLDGTLEARMVFSMNGGWQFFRPGLKGAPPQAGAEEKELLPPEGAEWEAATLPHTVRLEPRDVSGGLNYQGVCWYRKRFRAESQWKGRVVYLKFQGAMQVADVWLNGTHLTTHYGGYLPFTIDISKALRFEGENLLTVRLDNSDNPEVPPGKPQNELDFTYFGGLYRSVDLEVMDALHVTDPILSDTVAGGGIFVTFPTVDAHESIVQVKTEIANESAGPRNCNVTQELIGPDGSVAATVAARVEVAGGARQAVTQRLTVRDAKLWHPFDPQLYRLHTRIGEGGRVIDDQVTRIGIRSIRFDKQRGLLINGEPFMSIGANRHQDHPYVGYALPASAHYRDAFKLREAGFTSYRSHYPQDPSFMDACDELGILAVVSNPGWQFVGDEVFKRRVYQDAREMIRRDRNRPSVAIWEAQLNESDNRPLAAELYRIVHEEFPGPETYTAGDPIREPVAGFPGWDIEYLSFGDVPERELSSRASWIREWGDQVDNWSDQQSRVRVERRWGETPMLVQAEAHLNSMDLIFQMPQRPGGADLWAGIEAYRGYHHQPFLGAPIDLFRLPKFDYFMFQSQRPAEKKPVRTGSGPMVFIASFASFYSPLVVTVFSNCEQVRLAQNGKVVATQGPDAGYHVPHPPFSFKVGEFSSTRSMIFSNGVAPAGAEIGELLAEGLIGGEVVARHVVHSPGVPTELRLEVDKCGVDPVADGSDWVRVYAHVCDTRGVTYPFSDDIVSFSVSGEGAMLGGASIGANPLRAEAGIATALVRTTGSAGVVTVHAAAPGLKEAAVQFTSRAKPGRWV